MNRQRRIIIVLMILTIVFTFFGSILAYLNWQTADSQKTNIVFTLEQDFWCAADGGGNITETDVFVVPTTCTNSDHTIKREVTITPTILRSDLTIYMDLWLNVNELDNGLFNSDNFRYALTTNANSCTDGVIASGNFKSRVTGDKVLLLDEASYSTSTPQKYYLYVWLDAAETSADTMDQKFKLSLGGNCTDIVKGEMYYAVYSETDNSLRFYDDSDEIKEGTTYNNLAATKVYKTYQNEAYSYDSSTTNTTAPWNEIRNNVTKIVIEDEISPTSTAYWFERFTKVSSIDVSNLDTSK